MHTTRDRLQATLVELQQELAELEELEPATREHLQATLSDIRTALADKPAAEVAAAHAEPAAQPIEDEDDTTLDDERASQSLAERLNEATRELESTHPELSTTLGSVVSALAQMGI